MGKSAFDKAEEGRKNQPARGTTVVEGQSRKSRKKTVAISMNIEDHEKLKAYANEKGKTVSGVIKDWVDKYCK